MLFWSRARLSSFCRWWSSWSTANIRDSCSAPGISSSESPSLKCSSISTFLPPPVRPTICSLLYDQWGWGTDAVKFSYFLYVKCLLFYISSDNPYGIFAAVPAVYHLHAAFHAQEWHFSYIGSKTWNVIYILSVLIALGMTVFFYYEDLLGLSIFGLCSISFIRSPTLSYVPAVSMLLAVLLFISAGLFSLRYFRRHMPNTVGLRNKKYK